MSEWPQVVGEFETIEKIKEGFSISRFGDGEYGTLDGRGYTRQITPVPALIEELRNVILSPNKGCLIGIPTMDPRGDKYVNWKRHIPRYSRWLREGVTYYSSFITRPDCGRAWMESADYANRIRSIWRGKVISIVCEPYSKILADIRKSGEPVTLIECPMYNAYQHIEEYEKAIVKSQPDIALLSVGVTATALANRLSGHGIHAVDIGSIGGFLQRWP